jgi:hypothetical protein
MSWIDKRDQQRLFSDVASRINSEKTVNKNDSIISQRIADIYKVHPYMETGVVLALAEAGADPETINAAAKRSAQNAYLRRANTEKPVENPPDPRLDPYAKKSWVPNVKQGVFNALKWTLGNTIGKVDQLKTASRYVTAAAESVPQYIANYGSLRTDPNAEEKFGVEGKDWGWGGWNKGTFLPEGMFASTSLGALLQNGDQAGEGFFVAGEAEKKRVEKVKQFRWQINGESYTVGRGTANIVSAPGSKPYNFLSGLIDASIAWYADPVSKPLEVAAKSVKAGKAIEGLKTADEISAARKLASGSMGLLSTAEQHAIDNSKFFNWLDNSASGRRVVQRTADESDPLKILRAYGGKLSPEQARRLASVSDTDQVRGIIAEQAIRLSDETKQGFVPFASQSGELPIAGMNLVEKIPGYNTLRGSMWFSKVPKNTLIVHGTDQEKVQAIFNIENYLKVLKVDPYSGDGKKLIDKAFDWAGTSGTRVDADQMFRMFMGDVPRKEKGIVWTALEAQGVDQKVIEEVVEKFRSGIDTLRKNAIDEHGMTDDAGFIKHMTQFMTDTELFDLLKETHPSKVVAGMTRADLDDVVYNLGQGELTTFGPLAISDMLNNVQILPDPRQLRRLTNNDLWKLTPDGRQLQASAVAEWIQNDLWKPYALLSIGYIMRNTMDAQLRLGLNGFFSDPLQYILIAMRKRATGTIGGSVFVNEGEDIFDVAEDMQDYISFVNQKSKYLVEDPADQLMRMVRSGEAAVVNTSDSAYTTGWLDSARQAYADPFLRLMTQVQHLPQDRQLQIAVDWLNKGTDDAVKARDTLVGYFKDGPLTGDINNGLNKISAPISNADNMTNSELVEAWFDIAARGQIDNLTLGADELRVLAGYNAVPAGASELWDETEVMRFSVTGKKPKAGELLVQDITGPSGIPKFKNFLVLEVNKVPGADSYKVIEVTDVGTALNGDDFSMSARRFIDERRTAHKEAMNIGNNPLLPTWTRTMIRTKPVVDDGISYRGRDALKAFAAIPKWFFDVPVQKFTELAERSPAFRFAYYKNVSENAGLLSADEAKRLLDDLDTYAARTLPDVYAVNPEKAIEIYVGGRKFYDQILVNTDEAITKGTGVGTVEQLNTYASTRTKVDLEELFFNNVERSNLTDAFRVIAPFGAAWAEVAGRYSRELLQNPARIRKVQKIYRGLEGFDPDNDGRGIIYKDPITNDMMFTFPLSGQIIKAITGEEGINLSAPVKRLSAGLAIIPSVGPMFQIAATEVFNAFNIPDTDSFRKLVNPYGDASLENLLPGSFTKALSAIRDSPDELSTMYGNTYADLFAYMSTTGEYNLNDSEDVARLHDDAKTKARPLTMLRALSQFIGPTAARPDYRMRTEEKLSEYFYVNEMVKQFQIWQAEDYETAIGKFIDTFGESAVVYIGAKTTLDPRYKGVEASEAYGLWENKNSDLVRSHKSVAPYLAPIGDGALSMPVWSRQLNAGIRRRNDPVDRLEQAQLRVGSYLYRDFRKKNPNATAAEKKAERERIHKNFNGFPIDAKFDPNEFKRFIADVNELVADQRTANDPVANTIREYLKNREQAINMLKEKAGVSLAAEKNPTAIDYRKSLFERGEELATINPDFRRIWEQEFQAELE